MVCKKLLLPALAIGLAFYSPETSARNANLSTLAKSHEQQIHFVENKGQIVNQHQRQRPDIDFRLSAGNSLNIFIGSGKIHYQWAKSLKVSDLGKGKAPNYGLRESEESMNNDPSYKMHRMDVALIGANPDAQVITDKPQNFYERYYLSNMGENGTIAHAFNKITYKNVYQNIDWVLYVKGNTVEYDFVIRPGGKVSDIQLKYEGASTLKINADGSFAAITPFGEIKEGAPFSFQKDGKGIASRFILNEEILTFSTDEYSGTLIIDPTLEWSTYFGGLGNDQPTKIASDDAGNIYISGGTTSLDNIATSGSYQSVYGGSSSGSYAMGDVFLAKFNPSGDCLWSTYYGGTLEDRGIDMDIDKNSQSIYLSGSTQSTTGISTIGAHQESLGGNYDAFLVKFDTSGQRIWGTYYGGVGAEGNSYYSIGTVCDKDGNVFLTGETNSTDDIATPNGFQPLKGAGEDVFIAKFNSSGVRQWGTYLGGDGVDYAYSICADTLGNIFVVGNTTSNTGFATTGSNQSSYAGGTDGFVAKLNAAGMLQWLTYYGGNGYDNINAVQSDNSGNCYIVGITDNISNIATASSFQPAYGGGAGDGFFAKLNPQGQLVWSTYYGGNDIDEATSLVVSPNSDIFISGYSISPTGIATSGAYMDTLYNSTSECFLAKFDSMGQRYWATYYGGSGYETYSYVTTSDAYNLYLLGMTNSAEGISNQLSYQPDYGGGDADAFLTHFNLCEPPSMPVSILGDTIVCSGHGYTYHVGPVPGAVSYSWQLPLGWTGTSDSSSIDVVPDNSGTIYIVANNICGSSDSAQLHISVNPSPMPSIIKSGNILSTTTLFSTYQWNLNNQPINSAIAPTYVIATDGDYSVTVSNEDGCIGTSNIINGTTGIENISTLGQAIKIYPNPTSGILFISSPIPVNYHLKGMDGSELLSGKSGKSIYLKNLSSGMYFLQIYDNNGALIRNEKVIKTAK